MTPNEATMRGLLGLGEWPILRDNPGQWMSLAWGRKGMYRAGPGQVEIETNGKDCHGYPLGEQVRP